MDPDTLTTSGRARVDARDLAIAFAIVRTCTTKMNTDGSLPTERIKGIWDRMYDIGEVDRAFDYHRWKAIRDLMEAKGGLEMVDASTTRDTQMPAVSRSREEPPSGTWQAG